MTVINESGLYAVILRSDKPEAKPFRKWVTTEALPSIRKNGGNIAQQETLMAKALMVAQQTIADRESQASISTSATAPSLRPSMRSWAPALPRRRQRLRRPSRASLKRPSLSASSSRI